MLLAEPVVETGILDPCSVGVIRPVSTERVRQAFPVGPLGGFAEQRADHPQTIHRAPDHRLDPVVFQLLLRRVGGRVPTEKRWDGAIMVAGGSGGAGEPQMTKGHCASCVPVRERGNRRLGSQPETDMRNAGRGLFFQVRFRQ